MCVCVCVCVVLNENIISVIRFIHTEYILVDILSNLIQRNVQLKKRNTNSLPDISRKMLVKWHYLKHAYVVNLNCKKQSICVEAVNMQSVFFFIIISNFFYCGSKIWAIKGEFFLLSDTKYTTVKTVLLWTYIPRYISVLFFSCNIISVILVKKKKKKNYNWSFPI